MQARRLQLHTFCKAATRGRGECESLRDSRDHGSRLYNRPAHEHRAFTLIELMISIALVLLLILGVNQVFTYTTQAVGAGEAINSAIRSSRAAQGQFASDFNGIVPNGGNPNDAASIIIASRAYYAFRDAKDQAAQGNITQTTYPPAAYLDLAGTGNFGDPTVNGDIVYPATYNFRNHRLDVLSFFARGLFPRQTGNDGTFVDNMSSQEAWIWYGHLHLPDNSGNYSNTPNTTSTFPCMGNSATNPNNCYGSKLVLGRVAMLLKYVNGQAMYDNAGNPQAYYAYSASSAQAPLALGSLLNADGAPTDPGSPSWTFCDSRMDVADTSIYQYRQNVFANPPSTTPPAYWWNSLMDGTQLVYTSVNGNQNAWARFKCNPFIAKPMQSMNMAQASPYFLGGCSQFIVEFAGDFLKQDNDPSHTSEVSGQAAPANNHAAYGDVTGPGSDGQLDYVLTYPNDPNHLNPPVKQIQWYGMPRSTSGSSTINWRNGDVVPVRDRFQNMCSTQGVPFTAPYQNTFPATPTIAFPLAVAGYPVFEKYGPSYQPGDYKTNMTAVEANAGYECAFGPTYKISSGGSTLTVTDPAPKLIRITITLDDPTGRLPDGLTYQYVFPVPTP
jgi:prepilin-type N-terminal cleavage/methylation domain-containing protein